MAFFITTDTSKIAKVEIKDNPEFSNIAFRDWDGGHTLLITGVPSALGATLATLAQFDVPPFLAKELYIEVCKTPVPYSTGSGTYYETEYAGRIEIRN
jgi:hypothetical protein